MIDLDELEWRIEYLKEQLSLDNQIVEFEKDLSKDEKDFFEEEMLYLQKWINELENETEDKGNELNNKSKERIKWKIKLLKRGLESIIEVLNSNQKLDKDAIICLEEDSRYLKKWIKELK